MLVIGEAAVAFHFPLAFGDGQEEVIPSLRSLHIKEIRTFPRADRFRVDILALTLLRISAIIIISVHSILVYVFKCGQI